MPSYRNMTPVMKERLKQFPKKYYENRSSCEIKVHKNQVNFTQTQERNREEKNREEMT